MTSIHTTPQARYISLCIINGGVLNSVQNQNVKIIKWNLKLKTSGKNSLKLWLISLLEKYGKQTNKKD